VQRSIDAETKCNPCGQPKVEAKDIIIKKGNDKNVDCYSAFYDNLRKVTETNNEIMLGCCNEY